MHMPDCKLVHMACHDRCQCSGADSGGSGNKYAIMTNHGNPVTIWMMTKTKEEKKDEHDEDDCTNFLHGLESVITVVFVFVIVF